MLKKDTKNDFIILILLPLLISVIFYFYPANFLITTILLFGTPSFYLGLKYKKSLKKIFVFSLLFSIPFTFIFDYLIVKDKGWYIVNTVFPVRIFNIVAIEQFIWAFLWIFYLLIFYEYFFNKQKRRSIFSLFFKTDEIITKRMEYLSSLLFALLLFCILFAFLAPEYFKIDYAYLILGTVFEIIPLLIFFLKFPNFLIKFINISLYFLFVSLITEYTGLNSNHWIFPGTHFIGTINFLGFTLPYEEILLYFILSTPALLSYYEFFDDDIK